MGSIKRKYSNHGTPQGPILKYGVSPKQISPLKPCLPHISHLMLSLPRKMRNGNIKQRSWGFEVQRARSALVFTRKIKHSCGLEMYVRICVLPDTFVLVFISVSSPEKCVNAGWEGEEKKWIMPVCKYGRRKGAQCVHARWICVLNKERIERDMRHFRTSVRPQRVIYEMMWRWI